MRFCTDDYFPALRLLLCLKATVEDELALCSFIIMDTYNIVVTARTSHIAKSCTIPFCQYTSMVVVSITIDVDALDSKWISRITGDNCCAYKHSLQYRASVMEKGFLLL